MKNKRQVLQISIDQRQFDQQNNNQFNAKQSKKNAHKIYSSSSEPVIIGKCKNKISKNQKNSRQLNQFQKPTIEYKNWQPLACHFRNIEYKNQNVRTKETLIQCVEFVCKEYLPYYRKIFQIEEKRKKFELFLYDRVRAIRCQFYVQNIFQPQPMMTLLKLILFLQTMIGGCVELSMLGYFLDNKNLLMAEQNLKKYYFQALQFSFFSFKKQAFIGLLETHFSQIQNNPHLLNLLDKKLKIISNNYITFLLLLSSSETNIFTRLILWSQMNYMKQLILSMYKKSRMNQNAAFLTRILGYYEMKGWIDISKNQDFAKLQKNKAKFDLQINLWITQEQLLSALQNLQQSGDQVLQNKQKQLQQKW